MATLNNRLRRLEQVWPPEPNSLAELTDRELDEMIAADCAEECGIPINRPVEDMTDRELWEIQARSYGMEPHAIQALSDDDLQEELFTLMLPEVDQYLKAGNQ